MIYEWLMPILHLDARADLVQCIKLCEARCRAFLALPFARLDPAALKHEVPPICFSAIHNFIHLIKKATTSSSLQTHGTIKRTSLVTLHTTHNRHHGRRRLQLRHSWWAEAERL